MKKVNKYFLTVLTICFTIALSGCSAGKAEKKYYDDVTAAVNNAMRASNTLVTDLQTFLGDVTNQDYKNQVLTDLNDMEQEFTTLKNLTAPKIYKEAQVVFVEGAEAGLSGVDSYRSAVEECMPETLTDQEKYDTFYTLITKGDEAMSTVNTKISEAAQIADNTR